MGILVGHWPGEDNANDIINGMNGTWTGTPVYEDGIVNRCFVFNGSKRITVLNNALINFPIDGKFSIEFYLKTGNVNYRQYIFAKGNIDSAQCEWGIDVKDRKFNIYAKDNLTYITTDTLTDLVNSTWVRNKVAYDDGIWTVYTGDSLTLRYTSTYFPLYLPAGWINLRKDLCFGADPDAGYFLYGSLDEIKIYDDSTKTHTVIIENGLIQSWDIVDGGSPPATPNTHEVVMENGLIKEWNITSGGSRPSPSNNHSVSVLKGLVQTWAIA